MSFSVVHTVDSVAEKQGGPSRSVPALVRALQKAGVEASLSVYIERGARPLPAADIIHDHGIWLPSNHAASRAAREAGVPLVISPRGMLEPWALAQRPWKKQMAWALYQRADLSCAAAVHATSEAEAASIRAAGIRVPIAVIPNGVELPACLPPRTTGPARRALFLSRIHPKKGLPMLVEAWARVRPPGWELVLAGPDEGGHRADVEALVQQAGLGDAITFSGPVADVDKWALYRTADLFVLPTHSENFGLVVAEALAAGVPVLTTTGAPWKMLQTERCGWWAAPTVDSITHALQQATALSGKSLETMGERGKTYVHSSMSWDRMALQVIDVYSWILKITPQPSFVIK